MCTTALTEDSAAGVRSGADPTGRCPRERAVLWKPYSSAESPTSDPAISEVVLPEALPPAITCTVVADATTLTATSPRVAATFFHTLLITIRVICLLSSCYRRGVRSVLTSNHVCITSPSAASVYIITTLTLLEKQRMCQSQGIGHFFRLFPLFMTRSCARSRGRKRERERERRERGGE